MKNRKGERYCRGNDKNSVTGKPGQGKDIPRLHFK